MKKIFFEKKNFQKNHFLTKNDPFFDTFFCGFLNFFKIMPFLSCIFCVQNIILQIFINLHFWIFDHVPPFFLKKMQKFCQIFVKNDTFFDKKWPIFWSKKCKIFKKKLNFWTSHSSCFFENYTKIHFLKIEHQWENSTILRYFFCNFFFQKIFQFFLNFKNQ